MNKSLYFIIFVFIISCSTDNSTKTLTNCADHIYSNKEREFLPENFSYIIARGETWIPVTDLEKEIVKQVKKGKKESEIIRWYVELLKIPGQINNSRKYMLRATHDASIGSIRVARRIAYENDKKLKKFISKSLNEKLQYSKYERYFAACENIRKRTPKTFDAKWKKSNVIYNKNLSK